MRPIKVISGANSVSSNTGNQSVEPRESPYLIVGQDRVVRDLAVAILGALASQSPSSSPESINLRRVCASCKTAGASVSDSRRA